MARQLKVPTLEMDMEEVRIVRWLVEEGSEVRKGDPLLEIDTDKTSFEIESPADGVIRDLRGEEGETVPVGATLAYVTEPGEDLPEEPEAKPEEEPEPAQETTRHPQGTRTEVPPRGDGRVVRASPAARRAAAERGLPIEEIPGSGPHGRVYLSDVLEMDYEESAAEVEVVKEPEFPEPSAREPLSRTRRIGAERTARSFSEIPHFYLTRDLKADRLLELLDRLREKMEPAPSLTELVTLTVARTLGAHPRLNGRYADGELELNPQVNLGVAVATEEGLVVPVVKGADALSLRDLVPTIKDLVQRAWGGKLAPEELSGGTFTLSNLGMMGIDSFNAIINPPEAAILAIGRVRTVPQWREGEWVPHRVISATLSIDHRAADGADGSRFLEDLQECFLDWELLL